MLNMRHLNNDVRKDLSAPKMPFVIRMMGQIGSKPAEGAKLTIQKAQHAMEKILELSGQRHGGAD